MRKNVALPYRTILVVDCADKDHSAIALLESGKATTIVKKAARAQELPEIIDQLLKSAKVLPAELKALALVKRSGSMTAIRIGTATANTLAWINRLPIIEVECDGIETAIEQLQRGEIGSAVRNSRPFV